MTKLGQYRVLITGSRTWTDEWLMKLVLQRVWDNLHTGNKSKGLEPILVHGTAAGADQMAAQIWLNLGGTVEPHPADWDRWGKRAGYVRNAEMVDSGVDVCLAFIRDNSRGASMCARLAEKAGVKTLVVTED